MRERLRHDLTEAIKARDPIRVAALRSALAAIDNAEAVDVPSVAPPTPNSEHVAAAVVGVGAAEISRQVLSRVETTDLVREEVTQRLRAAGQYDRLGRADASARLRAEADVLSRYCGGEGTDPAR